MGEESLWDPIHGSERVLCPSLQALDFPMDHWFSLTTFLPTQPGGCTSQQSSSRWFLPPHRPSASHSAEAEYLTPELLNLATPSWLGLSPLASLVLGIKPASFLVAASTFSLGCPVHALSLPPPLFALSRCLCALHQGLQTGAAQIHISPFKLSLEEPSFTVGGNAN